MTATAYPLEWPGGWPRTAHYERDEGKYKYMTGKGYSSRKRLTMHRAQRGLYDELNRLGVESVVISSNLVLNLDGSIRSNQRVPEDPGIAIYFQLKGKSMSMACDDFIEPECNVRRLALAIKAMRDLERNGGGTMMEKAFSGFSSLPAPIQLGQHWSQTFNVRAHETTENVLKKIKQLTKENHPDTGGDEAKMAAINEAKAQFKLERGIL